MSFKQKLIEMRACKNAIDWVNDRALEQAWSECPRGDWMLWLLEKMEGKKGWLDEKKIMSLGCWCARRAMKYIPEREMSLSKAIEAKEAWTRGEIARKEMDAVMDIISDVIWDFTKTNDAVVRIIKMNVASEVASAVSCVVAYDITFYEELLAQADYIRAQFTPPKGDLCLLNNN